MTNLDSLNATDTTTTAEERSRLLRTLAGQRRHVLDAIAGLTDEQLRQAVLRSGWSILGLLRHLTLGLETYWFQTVINGAPPDYWPSVDDGEADGEAGVPAAWRVTPAESPATIIDEYRRAIDESDAIIAGLDLDAPPSRPDPSWSDCGLDLPDLRSVILHVIVDAPRTLVTWTPRASSSTGASTSSCEAPPSALATRARATVGGIPVG